MRNERGGIMKREILKQKLSEQHLTQGQLASRIGICENSMSRKMRGKREFRVSEVIAICNVLQIANPSEVFFDDDVLNAQRNL
jgi:transcriptional regulator with XRE-family HTH domain